MDGLKNRMGSHAAGTLSEGIAGGRKAQRIRHLKGPPHDIGGARNSANHAFPDDSNKFPAGSSKSRWNAPLRTFSEGFSQVIHNGILNLFHNPNRL